MSNYNVGTPEAYVIAILPCNLKNGDTENTYIHKYFCSVAYVTKHT